MRKAVFTIDDNKLAYIGYAIGNMPYFDMDEAIKIAKEFNTIAEYPIVYDGVYDQFYLHDKENDEFEIYKPKEFKGKKLHPIKSGYWLWDEFTEGNAETLAEGIVDWLWEFDTYEFRDQYADRADLLKEIKIQLKELETLAEAIQIYYSDILSAEEIYNALSKLLTV